MSPMLRRGSGIALAGYLAIASARAADVRDLYFGEALYYAHQGQYFEALQRLDAELGQYRGLDEPKLDSLSYHIGQAEFSVGDFELDYRMHHRAGRAIKAVLEGDVDEAVRNEAAFRLARIHFQKDQFEEAQHALDRIHGRMPDAIKDDVAFLRANVLMASARPGEAVDVLKKLQSADGLAGFAAYNLGIALLQDKRQKEALDQLDKAGQINAKDEGAAAIRDKSNLILGDLWFEANDFTRAQRAFDRVRLDGPFSNLALLRSGWAAASGGQFDHALAPWNLLLDRDSTDPAVQEALLAAPYAYGKLEIYGRAALLYGRALETFSKEIEKVDASIESIRAGKFLKALVSEEVRQNKDWVIRLRSLPETPETYYLMTLMASHDFQTALQNYLDLDDMRKKLLSWQGSFDAFDDAIKLRRANYEPLLPQVDARFRELDSQIRLRREQRKHIEERLRAMLTAPRPEYLANADERLALDRIDAIVKHLSGSKDPRAAELLQRAQRLQGAMTWSLRTQYHERLTQAYADLKDLNSGIADMTARYDAFVRTRQAAMHSYVGYDASIGRLRRRVDEALQKLNLVMARQGRLLEMVAINELSVRRDRLEAYQSQARFAVADSYDRAVKKQTEKGGAP